MRAEAPGERTAPDRAPTRGEAPAIGYIAAIDGLRAIAILSVLVYHLRPAWLPGGYVGVDVFFVVSGFVVTASIAHLRFERLRDLLAYFYARRMVRIVPALAAMLVLVSAASALVMIPRLAERAGATALAASGGASNILLAVRKAGYFEPAQDLNPFLHTWTLGVEEQFYLFFPFFFFFCQGFLRDLRRAAAAAGVVILIAVSSLLLARHLYQVDPLLAFYLMPTRLWELAGGMLLCLTIGWWRPLGRTVPSWLVALAFLTAAAILAFAFVGPAGPSKQIAAAAAASGLLIVLVCARPAAAPARALASPGPVFIGKISYSLYLWHWPIFALFRWTVGLQHPAAAAAAVALAFALALLSHYFVELPVRRAGKSGRIPRGRILITGAASLAATAAITFLCFHYADRITLVSYERTLARAGRAEPGRCRVEVETTSFGPGERLEIRPICAGAQPRRKVVVAGDSHARGYQWPLMRLAGNGVGGVIFWSPGCAYPPLDAPASRRLQCARYYRHLAAELPRVLRPGDTLFLASLQVERIDRPTLEARAEVPRPTPADRERAYREAAALLAPLARPGTRIAVAAPAPVFRSPVLRCVDWFNRSNPDCAEGLSLDRREMSALRRPAMDAMQRLAAEIPNVVIWDPLPSLCPGDRCSALAGDRLLYVDTDHLSPFAYQLLFPSFERAVEPVTAER